MKSELTPGGESHLCETGVYVTQQDLRTNIIVPGRKNCVYKPSLQKQAYRAITSTKPQK